MRAFFALLLFFTGCRTAAIPIEDASAERVIEGEIEAAEEAEEDITFLVHYLGDTNTWHHAMLTCVDGVIEADVYSIRSFEGVAFDSEGWAYLTTLPEECPLPHFNVWDDYGGNTNSDVLGETMEEDVDPPLPQARLYLWVFTQRYQEEPEAYEENTWEPKTENWNTGGRFWDGDVPQPTPFDSVVGWEFWEPIPTNSE